MATATLVLRDKGPASQCGLLGDLRIFRFLHVTPAAQEGQGDGRSIQDSPLWPAWSCGVCVGHVGIVGIKQWALADGDSCNLRKTIPHGKPKVHDRFDDAAGCGACLRRSGFASAGLWSLQRCGQSAASAASTCCTRVRLTAVGSCQCARHRRSPALGPCHSRSRRFVLPTKVLAMSRWTRCGCGRLRSSHAAPAGTADRCNTTLACARAVLDYAQWTQDDRYACLGASTVGAGSLVGRGILAGAAATVAPAVCLQARRPYHQGRAM